MNEIEKKMGPYRKDLYVVFAPKDDASYSVYFPDKKPDLPPYCASVMKLAEGQTATLVTSQYEVAGKAGTWACNCYFEIHCPEPVDEKKPEDPEKKELDPDDPPSYCFGAPGSGCGFQSPCPSGYVLQMVSGTCTCVPRIP